MTPYPLKVHFLRGPWFNKYPLLALTPWTKMEKLDPHPLRTELNHKLFVWVRRNKCFPLTPCLSGKCKVRSKRIPKWPVCLWKKFIHLCYIECKDFCELWPSIFYYTYESCFIKAIIYLKNMGHHARNPVKGIKEIKEIKYRIIEHPLSIHINPNALYWLTPSALLLFDW